MILFNVKQKYGPLPPESAVNLNKLNQEGSWLNLIEIELFMNVFISFPLNGFKKLITINTKYIKIKNLKF